MKPETKKDIRSLSLEDLRLFFTENHDQAFRGNQVYQWLWQKGVHDFLHNDGLDITRITLSIHSNKRWAHLEGGWMQCCKSHRPPNGLPKTVYYEQ